MGPAPQDPARAAELAARASYGSLVALIAARTRDLCLAEDLLAEAFTRALEAWPRTGVPDKPEAWLLTVARRLHGHRLRQEAFKGRAEPVLALLTEERGLAAAEASLPDAKLKLLFACAHPAIDPDIRTPLMLQTVLGLEAGAIATAFAVTPAAMGERLARAKQKIRAAGIPFRVPEPPELPGRLEEVLAAIYALYGVGWDLVAGAEASRGAAFVEEAFFLTGLVHALLPEEPEPLGLLALMTYCEARRGSRRSKTGAYVPFADQDTALWSLSALKDAEKLLRRASGFRRPGRFQTEAAIQSAHIEGRLGGQDMAAPLLALYDLLAESHPVAGVLVARAVLRGKVEGPDTGLRSLEALPKRQVAHYQPYWAARLFLLKARGAGGQDIAEARARAVALTTDPAVRAFLER